MRLLATGDSINLQPTATERRSPRPETFAHRREAHGLPRGNHNPPDDPRRELARYGLIPELTPPTETTHRRFPEFDRYRAALLGVAVGESRAHDFHHGDDGPYGDITADPHYWRLRKTGRISTIGQLTLALGQSLVDCGEFDPADYARRIGAWRHVTRGYGYSVWAAAVEMVNLGSPWYRSGVPIDSALPAACVVPLVLYHGAITQGLLDDVTFMTVTTNAHPGAVATALTFAVILSGLRSHTELEHALDNTAAQLTGLGLDASVLDAVRPDPTGPPPDSRTALEVAVNILRIDKRPHIALPFAAAADRSGVTAALVGAMIGIHESRRTWPQHAQVEYRDGFIRLADRLHTLSTGHEPPAKEPYEYSASGIVGEFERRYRFLNPDAAIPLTVDGITYPTLTHARYASLAPTPTHAELVRLAPTPLDAGRVSRGIPMDPYDADLLPRLNRIKFAPGTRLAEQLLWTGAAALYGTHPSAVPLGQASEYRKKAAAIHGLEDIRQELAAAAGHASAFDYMLANRPYWVQIDPDFQSVRVPELIAWETHLPEEFDKPLLCRACLEEGRREEDAFMGTLYGKLVPGAAHWRGKLVGLWKVQIVGADHPKVLTIRHQGDFPSTPVVTCPRGHYIKIPEYRYWARTDPDTPTALGSVSESQRLEEHYRDTRPPGAP